MCKGRVPLRRASDGHVLGPGRELDVPGGELPGLDGDGPDGGVGEVGQSFEDGERIAGPYCGGCGVERLDGGLEEIGGHGRDCGGP